MPHPRWYAGCLTALLLGATACGAPRATLTAAHRAAMVDSVEGMLTAWRDAFNARDFARAATFYSSDSAFRWLENGEMRFRTARELGDTMQAEGPGLGAVALSLVEPEITPVAPGVAEVTSSFAEKVTDPTGQMTGFAGVMSMTVIHGDSGWRFLVGHVSLVTPVVDTARAKGKARGT